MARTRLARETRRLGGRLRRNPADFWVRSKARSVNPPRWREPSLINSGSMSDTDSPLFWLYVRCHDLFYHYYKYIYIK